MANIKDFATASIHTAPSPATTGTSLVLLTGMGTRMPATPFDAVAHPEGELPTLDNAEKVTVTAVLTDTLTITRAQGDTTAKSIEAGWRLSNAIFSDSFAESLGTDDNYVTNAEKVKLSNLSGTNTGDQTSIVGLIGTTAQFNTANTDGDFATIAGAETLTNKTLTAPVLSGTVTGTYTIGGTPTFPSTVVSTTGTQTLTNKTLTSPVVDQFSTTSGIGAAWTAWTPTVTGLSGTPTVVARYKLVGKTMTCYLYINGISNATSFSATLPGTAAYGATAPCRIADNGTTPVAPGFVEPSGGTVFVYPTLTGGSWTASGQKILFPVVFTYEIT